MKKQILTEYEQKVWEAILVFLETYKCTPLRIELADELDISPQLLQYRLKRLQEKGWICLEPNKKRNICIK